MIHNEINVQLNSVIEKDEATFLVATLVRTQKETTQEQANALIDWATQARLDESLLRLVLKGLILPSFRDGELSFETTPDGLVMANINTSANSLVN